MPPTERQRPARPETRDLTELRALKARLPELTPAVDMQIELLELHRRIQLRVSTPSLPAVGDRQARLRGGRRVLELADLAIDWAAAGLSARQTADILHRHDVLESVDHRSLVGVVREGADLAPLVAAWYAETSQGPTTIAPASTRPSMLDDVLQLALRPFLGRAMDVASRGVDLGEWGRPWCPFCGAAPDFAVYLDDERRQLICSRCIGRWEWETIACPWCAVRDRRQLPSFTSADRRYRLCACDGCRRYLKAYNAAGAPRPVMPAVDSIATLPLDAAAVQRGYVGG